MDEITKSTVRLTIYGNCNLVSRDIYINWNLATNVCIPITSMAVNQVKKTAAQPNKVDGKRKALQLQFLPWSLFLKSTMQVGRSSTVNGTNVFLAVSS
jgi:hypothetical protein